MNVPPQLLDALVDRGETLAVAESLTGGLLAAAIVDVPGASRVFRGGLVVYATDLKASLAGVPAAAAGRSAVRSTRTWPLALAAGARERCGADWGLATTGVAGPGSAGRHRRSAPSTSPSGRPGRDAVRALTLTAIGPRSGPATVAAALDLLELRVQLESGLITADRGCRIVARYG